MLLEHYHHARYVVLILKYGIHTGTDSCYLPTAADFCMPGPLFARALHISQAKIEPGGPLFTPDQLSRDSSTVTFVKANDVSALSLYIEYMYA